MLELCFYLPSDFVCIDSSKSSGCINVFSVKLMDTSGNKESAYNLVFNF